MEVPHNMLIDVMLEEYRHIVSWNRPNPAWSPARPEETTLGLTAMRGRLSDALRAIADRLEPSGTRSPGEHLGVMPYPGDGAKTAC